MRYSAIAAAILCSLLACSTPPPAEQPSAGTVIRLNPAVDALAPADAAIELLDDQPFKYLEGPLWINENGGYMLFSDVPADIIYKWTPGGG
jgi:gluconolactonase